SSHAPSPAPLSALSLHDALPICSSAGRALQSHCRGQGFESPLLHFRPAPPRRGPLHVSPPQRATRAPRVTRRTSPASKRHGGERDRKSTRLNSSHVKISYAVFCL